MPRRTWAVTCDPYLLSRFMGRVRCQPHQAHGAYRRETPELNPLESLRDKHGSAVRAMPRENNMM
jgi:hypothetical protein